MSLFQDYDNRNYSYDSEGRIPVCVDQILDEVPRGAAILDAGCGTGNYITPIVRSGKVASYVALDASEGMLGHARSKKERLLKDGFKTEVTVIQHSLHDRLPFEDDSFDVILHNQVIHHIVDPEEDDRFHMVRRYVAEFYRVVKPGGVVGINFTTAPQHETFYWVRIIPSVHEMQRKLHPLKSDVKEILCEAGFKEVSSFADRTPLTGDNFFQYERCFSEDYRNADSSWSMASSEDLRKFLQDMRRIMRDEAEKKQFDEGVRKLLRERGASTQIFARK